ncbi:MAG: zf-HC2 domain-containing protein [Acidobacteria bacterium]|nr:zf-HC2 domain-containing protein [Acidobacteriota bacterium]
MDGLTDYLEGFSPAEQQLHLHEHLDHCPECRILIESARQTLSSMGSVIQ